MAIELRVLTSPQRIVLIKGNNGEALDELVYCQKLQFAPPHSLKPQIWTISLGRRELSPEIFVCGLVRRAKRLVICARRERAPSGGDRAWSNRKEPTENGSRPLSSHSGVTPNRCAYFWYPPGRSRPRDDSRSVRNQTAVTMKRSTSLLTGVWCRFHGELASLGLEDTALSRLEDTLLEIP